jgi:hypothetical protein
MGQLNCHKFGLMMISVNLKSRYREIGTGSLHSFGYLRQFHSPGNAGVIVILGMYKCRSWKNSQVVKGFGQVLSYNQPRQPTWLIPSNTIEKNLRRLSILV